jgi:hypothetical protein
MNIQSFPKQEYLDDRRKNILYTEVLYDPFVKKIVNFTVIQFYIDQNGSAHQVIKHDFSHGCYNIHRYYLGRFSRKEAHAIELSSSLFHRLKKESKENWKAYRTQFLMRWLPHELKGEH